MIKYLYLSVLLIASVQLTTGQTDFPYTVELTARNIPGLDGLHSFAHAQYEGKWIFIGGRRDGLHARQPFNSFPASDNNTDIYLVDPLAEQSWTASVEGLPVALSEQLQSTNLQYYQDGNELILIGGYAYRNSEGDHLTMPYLTLIDLPGLVQAIESGNDINPYFQQLEDEVFAVTGGQLGKINDTYYLIGGHRFDGRYNPMGHPTFVQTYTDAIRKFKLTVEPGISYTDYEEITDPVHLHRRDYNLLPQLYPDGSYGYAISSGVFQINQDLPYLYPVNISEGGYDPILGFNQFLSNYHSAHASLYNEEANSMHHLFFGGISQYYYNGEVLIQDDLVPFVKTISLLSRDADGLWEEKKLEIEMPDFLGASAEFLINEALVQSAPDVISLSPDTPDSILLGHIAGGIKSETLNPFSFNNTGQTMANNTVYSVSLKRATSTNTSDSIASGYHDFTIEVFPNPADNNSFRVRVNAPEPGSIEIFMANSKGQLLVNTFLEGLPEGESTLEVELDIPFSGPAFLTAVLNGIYNDSKQMIFK